MGFLSFWSNASAPFSRAVDAHYSIQLAAGPDVVFEYLTNEELLVTWWPSGARTDPVPAGTYHLWWDGPGWHLRGEYLTVDRPSRLVFTWAWDHEDLASRRVSITLDAVGETLTALAVIHEADSAEEADSYREGWEHFLGALDAAVHDQ